MFPIQECILVNDTVVNWNESPVQKIVGKTTPSKAF